MGLAFQYSGRFKEGERQTRRGWEIRCRLLGRDHLDTLKAESQLVLDLALQAIHQSGQLAEAEKMGRHVFEARRRLLGPEHPDTLESMLSWGLMLNRSSRPAEALDLFERAHVLHVRVFGPEDRKTLWALDHMRARS